MRKLAIALCLATVSPVYLGGYANAADMVYKAPAPVMAPAPAPAQRSSSYYWDYGWFTGYGPFLDCGGGRCYVGPVYQRGPRGRQFGQYYYGPTGGYYHGWAF
jgi:hypothetical protein